MRRLTTLRSTLSAALLTTVLLPGCDSTPEQKTDAKAAPVAAVDAAKPGAETPVARPDAPADDKAHATRTTTRKPPSTDKPAGGADKPAGGDDKPAAAAKTDGDEGTVAQKEGWATYQKELQRKVDAVNKACGTTLSASYDKSTYTDFDPLKDRTQSACQQAVGTLQAICAADPGKTSVAKLTRATCKFSTSGTGVSLSGSTLVIKIDPEKSSIVGKQAGSYGWASAIKEVI